MFSELAAEEEKSTDNSLQKTGKPLNTALDQHQHIGLFLYWKKRLMYWSSVMPPTLKNFLYIVNHTYMLENNYAL